MTVTASPADQARLLEVQTIDTRTQQIAHAGKVLPQHAELLALSSQDEALRRTLAADRGSLEDARTELKRVESDVAVVEARVKRDSDRLAATSSPKDAQALEHELASLRKRQDDLEEIELGVMELVEERERRVQELTAERERLAAQAAEVTAARDAALGELTRESDYLVSARATLTSGLPSDLVELYDRQRTRYGIGAALLRRGISEGSNMALTESDLAMVRSARPDEIVLDPESGCILVRTEESGL